MGTLELFLCILVGHLITVQSVTKEQDVWFSQDISGFSENLMPLSLEANFDFTPYDTIFSSWRTQTPDFHMLADSSPNMVVPRVQVFCGESKLILLVDKRSNSIVLTREEIRLGDSCYSNRELPNHFVFTYTLNQCGTTHVMRNGLKIVTNSLHLNLSQNLPSWGRTPSTVHISCSIPKRPSDNPGFDSTGLPETDKSFRIKAMNPSWTSNAESNVYKRDQVIHLQVSTKPRPNQQLFIQSCFLSASPDPQIRHKHMVIMNKGCTSHTAAQFVASDSAHVVNFVLNTTYPYAELYIHCSVLTSDQGVTSGSKSCNYHVIHSRWEELSGDVEVCKCCSSKCKGLSVKRLSTDAKALVSTGPLVFVDRDVETSKVSQPEDTASIPITYSMKLDRSSDVTGKTLVYESISRREFSSPPQGVVVVRQNPVARLTLWQSGQVEDPLANLKGQSALKHDSSMWDLNALTLVDGWLSPPQLNSAVVLEEFQRNKVGGFGKFGTDTPQVTVPLSDEMNVKDRDDFNHIRDEMAQMQADAPVMSPYDDLPIYSKIQFSKSVDGSQTLSYEEQIVGEQGKGVIRGCAMGGTKRKLSAQKGIYSSFLDLLRRMDKAE